MFVFVACTTHRSEQKTEPIRTVAGPDLTEAMVQESVQRWLRSEGTVSRIVWVDQKGEGALVRLQVIDFRYPTAHGSEKYCGFCEAEFCHEADGTWRLARFRTTPKDSPQDSVSWELSK